LSLSIGGEIIERIGNDCPTENNLFRCPQCIKWCESFFLYVLCFRALRAHFLIQLRKFSLCIHCLKKKKVADFIKKIVYFQHLIKIKFVGGKFLKFWSSINLPWGHVKSHKKLGPIGSPVLTFIGYKQTSKVYIYI